MPENYTLYFYIAFGATTLLLTIWVLLLELRLRRVFKGTKADNLENIMAQITKNIEKINISEEETKKYLGTVEKRLRNSLQGVGVVRFNPFENSGSNQSFAIALLNEYGNGTVISSLYSREKVSVYAKPIKNGQSEYSLSKEEEEAIAIAKHTNGEE